MTLPPTFGDTRRAVVPDAVALPRLFVACRTPVFGSEVRFVLLGGKEIGTDTLLRWYVLHVLLLPFVIVIFMAIHFWRVRKDGGISGPL